MLPSSSWHLPTPVLWYAGCGYVRAREDRVESTAGLGLARPVIPPVHGGAEGAPLPQPASPPWASQVSLAA